MATPPSRIAHPMRMIVVALGGVLTALVLTTVADALPSAVQVRSHFKRQPLREAVVFVSPAGNDGTCRRGVASRPCATFDRAYQIARQGDRVQVAAGSYEDETILYDPSKAGWRGSCNAFHDAGCVTFEPRPGASVQIGEVTSLDTGGATLRYKAGSSYTLTVASTAGFQTGGTYEITVGGNIWKCHGGADATHFYGCVAPNTCNGGTGGTCNWANRAQIFQGGIDVSSAAYVRFRRFAVKGSVGVNSLKDPAGAGSGHTVHDVVFQGVNLQGTAYASGTFSPSPPHNIAFVGGTYGDTNVSRPALYIQGTSATVIRGVTVQNVLIGACVGNGLCHVSGTYLSGNRGLVIERSSYKNVDVYDIFHSNSSNAGVNPDETITNNYFDCSNPYGTTIYWSATARDTISNVLVRGNYFRCDPDVNTGLANGSSLRHWVITDNIFGGPECPTEPAGHTGAYNVVFRRNIEVGRACSGSRGLIANGNLTITDVGIGGDVWR